MDDVKALVKALADVEQAAEGGSNDRELEALNDALDMALARWPEITPALLKEGL